MLLPSEQFVSVRILSTAVNVINLGYVLYFMLVGKSPLKKKEKKKKKKKKSTYQKKKKKF
jgi:Tfp pilus assembly protein PilO